MENVMLLDRNGEAISCENPIETTACLIKAGYLIGIKGVGGYHLCGNAKDEETVKKLRTRKKREHKPLAIMARDILSVEKICHVSSKEMEVLLGREKPILLLKKKTSNVPIKEEIIPEIIAPRQSRLGVMIPYTDIHRELFNYGLEFLIMTSANISGLPICYKDQDAIEGLKEVVDYYLIHKKEILIPIDDSVVRVIEDKVMISRCGRGYAPCQLPLDTTDEILALGAEQKGSICVTKGGKAYTSQYLGDVKDYDVYRTYTHVIRHMQSSLHANPNIYVHDLNLDYLSAQYGKKQNGVHIPVQHHHAHMASCMGEHGLWGDVIGVIFDGTGLGTDGTVWGGEFLVGSRGRYNRVGHLQYTTLQGGDMVVKELWRSMVCYLYGMGINLNELNSGVVLKEVSITSVDLVWQALNKGINCFTTSSMGRLFDCVAALTGLREVITYDAQGAIELESQIDEEVMEHYSYEIYEEDRLILGYESILRGIIEDVQRDIPIPTISAKFHNSIIKATIECACKIREKTKINKVVLSGGVFENVYLLKHIYTDLKKSGFEPYCNQKVPINDGGISYGQAVIAYEWIKEGKYVPGSSSNNH